MPHPRMCPDFYDGAVAAALIEAEEAGIGSDTSGSGGPVDLSFVAAPAGYCSPYSRVPISRHWSSPFLLSTAAISRRDSYASSDTESVQQLDANAWYKSRNLTSNGIKTSGMPRVVENQRDKFDTDAVFRRLSREVEVRYAGVPFERPVEQRRQAFERDLERGSLLMSVVSSGIHFVLAFQSPRDVPEAGASHDMRDLFLAEIRNNQLLLRARMILNGVCVIWTGHIDMQSLDGLGRIEFDTATAEAEAVRAARGTQ